MQYIMCLTHIQSLQAMIGYHIYLYFNVIGTLRENRLDA